MLAPDDPPESRPPRSLRSAAVLVPVFRDAGGALRVVIVRRAAGGIHGDQLAFPGGGIEPHDASPRDAALREAEEEIGLPRASVEVLADLPPLTTRTSGIAIAPFLARIQPPARWRPDPREIAAVIEPRLDELARPEARGRAMARFGERNEPRPIDFYRVGDQWLWGASYRIFHPLLPRILAGEWEI